MPIEIRELNIKAIVEEGDGATGNQGVGSDNGEVNRDEIIRICVDKVLEVLREKLER